MLVLLLPPSRAVTYLYADELKSFSADGITELHTAFSRGRRPEDLLCSIWSRRKKDKVLSLIAAWAAICLCLRLTAARWSRTRQGAALIGDPSRTHRRRRSRRLALDRLYYGHPRTATCSMLWLAV